MTIVTYGTFSSKSYGYPEYDYIYTDTKYRPIAAPSPSVLEEVTKFVSSGKCKLVKGLHFVNKLIEYNENKSRIQKCIY